MDITVYTKGPVTFNSAALFGVGIFCGWIMRSNSVLIWRKLKLLRLKRRTGLDPNLIIPRVKMVIVVRPDIDMGCGKIASQCAHAAIACVQRIRETHLEEQWEAQGRPKIVLRATPGVYSLMELYNQARFRGLPCTLIHDAGRTQVTPGTTTVLGIGPADARVIDEITGHLSLL